MLKDLKYAMFGLVMSASLLGANPAMAEVMTPPAVSE
jgi:hypothetical protein